MITKGKTQQDFGTTEVETQFPAVFWSSLTLPRRSDAIRRWTPLSARWSRRKIVPTWNCSQQDLWIILRTLIAISGKGQILIWCYETTRRPTSLKTLQLTETPQEKFTARFCNVSCPNKLFTVKRETFCVCKLVCNVHNHNFYHYFSKQSVFKRRPTFLRRSSPQTTYVKPSEGSFTSEVAEKKLEVNLREVYVIRPIPFDQIHPGYATVGRASRPSPPELWAHLTLHTDWSALNISEEQLKLVDSNPISQEGHTDHRWGYPAPPPPPPPPPPP